MTVEVIGIDHAYVTVRDQETSEGFCDLVIGVLGFRKRRGIIGGDIPTYTITTDITATR